jgi:hypothetical protein
VGSGSGGTACLIRGRGTSRHGSRTGGLCGRPVRRPM